MSYFLRAELTKKLENLNAELQQDQEINSQGNGKFENTDVNLTNEEINDEIMKDYEGSEQVSVSRIRRYKASIAAENVKENTFAKKLTNINKKISHVNDFMRSRIVYIQNKTHICTVYGRKIACDIKLFDDNDF